MADEQREQRLILQAISDAIDWNSHIEDTPCLPAERRNEANRRKQEYNSLRIKLTQPSAPQVPVSENAPAAETGQPVQLGTCSTQVNPGTPHSRCYECVDWKPIATPPALTEKAQLRAAPAPPVRKET